MKFELLKKNTRPGITRELMSALVKARSVSGPYTAGMSFRECARDVIGKAQDGDHRTKFGLPDMTVTELAVLREAAE